MTAFAGYDQHLISREPARPNFVFNSGSPYLEFPIVFSNQEHGRSYGGELSVNWNATARWRISPSLSLLDSITRRNAGSQDAFADQVAEYSPKRQFQVHSWLTLPHSFEWDSSASYVGSLKIGIPGYTRVDSRFGWRFGETAELSVVGQNLLTPRHAEFPDEYGLSHTRAVSGKVTWRF